MLRYDHPHRYTEHSVYNRLLCGNWERETPHPNCSSCILNLGSIRRTVSNTLYTVLMEFFPWISHPPVRKGEFIVDHLFIIFLQKKSCVALCYICSVWKGALQPLLHECFFFSGIVLIVLFCVTCSSLSLISFNWYSLGIQNHFAGGSLAST